MITAERNRLARAPKVLRKEIAAHIRWLENRLLERDRELDRMLPSSPLWREREDLLRGVPGVGPVLCATLLAELPELGRLGNRRELNQICLCRDSISARQTSLKCLSGSLPLKATD